MAFHHEFDPKDKRAIFVFDVFADLLDLRIITTGIKILLGFIGLLTLGIGGVGLMNIMLVSVTQRTREIGVEKALGARGWHILVQFLAEALVITLLGGLAGVVLAYIVSWSVGSLLLERKPVMTEPGGTQRPAGRPPASGRKRAPSVPFT